MKTLGTILATLLISGLAHAQVMKPTDVPKQPTVTELDLMKTCTSAEQVASAKKAITWLFNFAWWQDVKGQLASVHPEFMTWHSAWSFAYLNKIGKFPFKNGQLSKDDYLKGLAYIAYTNDIRKYGLDFKRLDCVGSDSVVVSSVFHTRSLYRRESDGKALFATETANAPTRIYVSIKDGLIYRMNFELSDSLTIEIAQKLGALAKAGTPNVADGEVPDATFEQLLQYFETEANQ